MCGEGHAGQNWDLSCMTSPLRYWRLHLLPTWVERVWEPCPSPVWEQCTQLTWPMTTIDFKGESHISSFYTQGHFKTVIMEIPDPARWQMLEDCRLEKGDHQAVI